MTKLTLGDFYPAKRRLFGALAKRRRQMAPTCGGGCAFACETEIFAVSRRLFVALGLIILFLTPVAAQVRPIGDTHLGQIAGISNPLGAFAAGQVGDLGLDRLSSDAQTSADDLTACLEFDSIDRVQIGSYISKATTRNGLPWTWNLLLESVLSTTSVSPLDSSDLSLGYSLADWSEGPQGTVVQALQPSGPGSVLGFTAADLRPPTVLDRPPCCSSALAW